MVTLIFFLSMLFTSPSMTFTITTDSRGKSETNVQSENVNRKRVENSASNARVETVQDEGKGFSSLIR